MSATCTGCNALIVFAKHYRTGSPMPFDAMPLDLTACVVPAEREKYLKAGWILKGPLAFPATHEGEPTPTEVHLSHWVSCPHARRFRKKPGT